jgi:5-formyltetrahydrofolate cyclo-ligase
MTSTQEEKTTLRKKALKIRQEVTDPAEKSKRIADFLLESSYWDSSNLICLYISFRTEVDTGLIVSEAIKTKRQIAIPRVEDDSCITLFSIQTREDLVQGMYGIMEPSIAVTSTLGNRIEPSQLSMILVPALAFDPSGNRLGYGKGCYDRLLEKLPSTCVKIGLAFSDQIFREIPAEPFDQKVDIILTEDGFMETRG